MCDDDYDFGDDSRCVPTQDEMNEMFHEDISRLENILIKDRQLPFKRLCEAAQLPHKAGDLEACYDFHCVADDTFMDPQCIRGIDSGATNPFKELAPGDSHVFHTGVSCAIAKGQAMFLWDRSGMGAKKNIHRLAGCIDSTYRGEILVSLINLSRETHIIEAGDRIIQGHLALVLPGTPTWVDELPESYRGDAGFGSTGA